MLAKRLFDLVAALAGLLLLAPLLLGLALWIRCDTPGPALFRQRRVGRHGVPFDIYKFRTMRDGAEAAGQLSTADDPRGTRAGRLLRRTKLDELPQLLNVVRGQMSLVGPRPEVPRYVAHYPPQTRAIVLSVAPGITDWAALHFRHEGELLRDAADREHTYLHHILPVKLGYHLRYVQQRSFAGDLHILLRTAQLLLLGDARPGPRWPRIQRRAPGRLAPHESELIAALRGLAALQVAAAHLRAHILPGWTALDQGSLWYLALSFVTGFAHQAVLIFFILSGWLVGGKLLDTIGRPHALRDYALDRVTRLWTVLLPACLLHLALATAQTGRQPDGTAWSAATLLGNLLGLQRLAVPVFGDNFPLWSLAYESWYYLLFPLLATAVLGHRARHRAGALLLVLLALALLGDVIAAYFLVWLLGAAAARWRAEIGAAPRHLLLAAFVVLACWLRLRGQEGDWQLRALGTDLGYSLVFLLCLTSARPPSHRVTAAVRRAGAWFAGFSFTLYVLHVPLLQALWQWRGGGRLSPQEPLSIALYAAMLSLVVALSYLCHLPCEAQTPRLRAWLRRHWFNGAPASPVGADADRR